MADLHVLTPEPPTADVVQTIERALELARAGELSSIGLAYVYCDGAVGCAWSALPSQAAMLGSLARLAYKINLEADE